MSRKPSARMFPNTCDHQRVTFGKDASGGKTESAATLAAGLRCAIEGNPSQPRQILGKPEAVITHEVFFPADPGVKQDDRLIVGSRTFQVLGPAVDESGRVPYFVVPCLEIR